MTPRTDPATFLTYQLLADSVAVQNTERVAMAGRGNGLDRSGPQDQASSEDGLDPSKENQDQGVRSVLPDPPKKAQRAEPNAMALAGAGLEIGLTVAGLTLVGWWLDGRWGTRPWLMLAGLAVAIVGGTYNVWKLGRSFFDD